MKKLNDKELEKVTSGANIVNPSKGTEEEDDRERDMKRLLDIVTRRDQEFFDSMQLLDKTVDTIRSIIVEDK